MSPGSRSLPRAASWRTFRPRTATSGGGFPPRAWCFSAISTPTSSPPAGRPTRSGSPGTSTARPGGRAAAPAAALAARMAPAATGTDTAGSLRIPSACCGTSAIKPTRGLVSLAGVVPLAWSLDHAGPMARTRSPTARCCSEAMAGPDRRRRRPRSMPHRPTGCRSARRRDRWPAFDCAVSPRLASVELDADVAAGFERRARRVPPARRRSSSSRRGPAFRTPSATTSSTC